MGIKKNGNRQEVLSAVVIIALADLVAGVAQEAIDLPAGAIVTGGDLVVTAAFNSTTSDKLDVGDSAVGNRLLGNGEIHATGRVPLVPTGFIHDGNALTVKWTSGGGTPTTGALRLTVQYVIDGRATSCYG